MTVDRSREANVELIRRQIQNQARAGWDQLRAAFTEIQTPAISFMVHLLIVLAVATSAMIWLPEREVNGILLPPQLTGLAHYLVEPLIRWDGAWYTLIATHGYQVQRETAAFWPLYPLLLRIGNLLTGMSIPVVGVILSNIALLAGMVFFHRLIRIDYGEVVAKRAVWLLALFPTAFYFSAVYTESLFLLTTVAAVYFARTERWGMAAVAGFFAAMTRNTGALVLIPLAILLIDQRGWHPRDWWQQGLQLAIIPLGPLVFLWHLYRIWGDPLLTVHVQSHWGRYPAMPWETISDAFGRLGTFYVSWAWGCLTNPGIEPIMQCVDEVRGRPSPFAGPLAVFGMIVIIPIAIYTFRRVRPAYGLYATILFILPLFSPSYGNPLMSMPRFVVVLFPLFIGMALLLSNRWVYRATLIISAILMSLVLMLFSIMYFVG